MPHPSYRFAEAVRGLLSVSDAADIEACWGDTQLDSLGWRALAEARRSTDGRFEAVLDEIDGLLLRSLDRLPPLARSDGAAARRLRTFRIPELERLQHATAAALVAHRYGPAGLVTMVADVRAPVARRYFAFFTLAEQHPSGHWPRFARYLTTAAHHAFLGAAAEAARFYPEAGPSASLVDLFNRVRADTQLRAFLSPRLLQSLFVLGDPGTLPFFRDLLVCGHTAADSGRCEVTRALVSVRRFTGVIEPSAKFPTRDMDAVAHALDGAERIFELGRARMSPVVVI
ncbi:MAG TPA: hypothetical protein VGA37_16845 [Gemmatimonadales bacterium]